MNKRNKIHGIELLAYIVIYILSTNYHIFFYLQYVFRELWAKTVKSISMNVHLDPVYMELVMMRSVENILLLLRICSYWNLCRLHLQNDMYSKHISNQLISHFLLLALITVRGYLCGWCIGWKMVPDRFLKTTWGIPYSAPKCSRFFVWI